MKEPGGTKLTLRDGTPVSIRAARPADFPALVSLYESLDERSAYLRFFGRMPGSCDELVRRLPRVGAADGFGLVALGPSQPGVVAVAGCVQNGADAEVSLLVADRWRGRGLGFGLTGLLANTAALLGIGRLHAEVLWENRSALAVVRRAGFRQRFGPVSGVVTVEAELRTNDQPEAVRRSWTRR